jgi:hypothetical protein
MQIEAPKTAESPDSPPTRCCDTCQASYWDDHFTLCPACDEQHLILQCGAQYAAYARRKRNQAQEALAHLHAPAAPTIPVPENLT